MNLFLVRHGLTEANINGRLVGWQDIELTEEGEKQAALTAEALYKYTQAENMLIDTLYVSPLKRTQRTAAAIAERFDLTPILEPDLREIHFGEIEGMTMAEWQAAYPELAASNLNTAERDFTWPGGESRNGFYARAVAVIDRLAAAHAPDDNIIVVSHGGVISAFVAHVLAGDASRWMEYRTDNCSITRITVTDGRASDPGCIVGFNDIAHLGENPVTYWPNGGKA